MKTLQLQLPATSANLGPGFDALALALELFLEIDASPASAFAIQATGRNHEICSRLEKNLLIETYRSVLAAERRQVAPLAIRMRNDIPLGMGCGSSAAACLAGVALAVHFGSLGWSSTRIVETAAHFEGHPDNVAACWYGGFTVAAGSPRLSTVSISPPPDWKAILVLPGSPVATEKSRSVLPESYSRADAVANVQNVALLTAAFALRRGDLLSMATADRLHQPYRASFCPLLPALSPLAGSGGVLAVTLSGAGPAVLLLHAGNEGSQITDQILEHSRDFAPVELVEVGLWGEGTSMSVRG